MEKKTGMPIKAGRKIYTANRVLEISDQFIGCRCPLREFARNNDIPLSSLQMVVQRYLPNTKGGKKRSRVVNKIVRTYYQIYCEAGGREASVQDNLLRKLESYCRDAGF